VNGRNLTFMMEFYDKINGSIIVESFYCLNFRCIYQIHRDKN